MQEVFLAVDIGASSGRHIAGWMQDGTLHTEELYRFPNGVQRVDGHLIWDIDGLFRHVKEGLKAALARYPHIKSVSIDTWAVDYVLLKDGRPIYPVYAYRDSRTQGMDKLVEQRVPFQELYRRTGIQKQDFNTIYQLMAVKTQEPGLLEKAQRLLMVPE